ncbi:MAG: hypothetical protein ABSC23_17725 [Bryobacteraceae bacterium]|jgi:hypothetical protein
MTRWALWLALAPAAVAAALPAAWVPARWEGGPLELARRAGDKALAKPELREAIAGWYDPATLSLLDGTPVNCLLLTLSAGADPQIEKRQGQLVKEYARRAHERGIAVVGLAYPGADPAAVAAAAGDAQLEGIALEGEFPGGLAFAERLEKILRGANSAAVVIPIAPSPLLRRTTWPVMAVEGVSPGVGKADDSAVAGPTGGVWLDSNMWLARSFHAGAGRPVWISHRPRPGSPGIYARSIADAAAAGAHWIVTLDDDLRAGLLRREAGAMAEWRGIASDLAFFESRPEWRGFAPFGKVGIVLDASGPAAAESEEYMNLVARRRIPYRVLYRADVGAATLAGLRAALAFDLAPATEAERTTLRAFAAQGGLVLTGPSWGGAPKDQSYTVLAEGEGEIAVYKDNAPDPQSVARDLSDLIPDPELGVSIANSPSVLSYVSTSGDGAQMLIQLVNYATEPAQSMDVWVTGQVRSARLHVPNGPSVELQLKRSGGQTEIAVPQLAAYGAVLCSLSGQPSGK